MRILSSSWYVTKNSTPVVSDSRRSIIDVKRRRRDLARTMVADSNPYWAGTGSPACPSQRQELIVSDYGRGGSHEHKLADTGYRAISRIAASLPRVASYHVRKGVRVPFRLPFGHSRGSVWTVGRHRRL